jgi:hypothetical protein
MLVNLYYLPNTAYFGLISEQNEITLEINDFYQKQSYRNRCTIITSQKTENLVIPVHKIETKTVYKNIQIDYHQPWLRQHLGALKAAYGKSAFFEYYFPLFESVFSKKHHFLVDLNNELLTLCLKLLKLNIKIKFTQNYNTNPAGNYREYFNPKTTTPDTQNTTWPPYNQNFGQNFVANLSIIDLLFCQGPASKQFLAKTSIMNNF